MKRVFSFAYFDDRKHLLQILGVFATVFRTNYSYENIIKKPRLYRSFSGRDEWTRTTDPHLIFALQYKLGGFLKL